MQFEQRWSDLTALVSKIDWKLDRLDEKLDKKFDALERKFAAKRTETAMKGFIWLVLIWVITALLKLVIV